MDSRLRKEVEPTGPVGWGGATGSQESRMTCPAQSNWVNAVRVLNYGGGEGSQVRG